MNAYGRLLLVALAALAAWSVWWLRNLQTATTTERGALAHRIDYTMDKLELTAMDTQGKPHYRLQALSMAHFADDDSTEFQQPHVDYINKDGSHLQLSAARGWMASRASEIRLLDGVRIDGHGQRPFTLTTRDVQIFPDQNLVTTDAATQLTAPGLQVSAVGMRVHTDQQRVQLLSRVRGRYDARIH